MGQLNSDINRSFNVLFKITSGAMVGNLKNNVKISAKNNDKFYQKLNILNKTS